MKNNYIKIVLNENNEFRAKAKIAIPNINILGSNDVIVKIDTGCPYTSFPVKKLGMSDKNAQIYKQLDSNDTSIKKHISFGVNDSQQKRENDRILFRNKQYMQLTSVTFEHSDVAIKLMDIDINTSSVKISYDRTGNILIGMDILKNWDIHIGTIDNPDLTDEVGQTIFLGCPRNQMNDAYLSELDRLFGTITSMEMARAVNEINGEYYKEWFNTSNKSIRSMQL